jgi:hypothetical protein
MEAVKGYIDEKVEDKFKLIENKLRNSFQAVKEDNELIKEKLKELGEGIEASNSRKVLKDFDKFRAEVLMDLDQIKDQIKNNAEELRINSIVPVKDEVKAMRKELNKKNIKEDVKNQLRKEVLVEFEKKIDNRWKEFSEESKEMKKNFNQEAESLRGIFADKVSLVNHEGESLKSAFSRKLSELKKENSSYKKELSNKTTYAIENVNATARALKDHFEAEKEAFARNVKSRNNALEKEITIVKEKISDKLYESFKERDEKILKVERQIAYLKGKLRGEDVSEIPEIKKVESKKSVKSKDEQKPFFIRVLTGKEDSKKSKAKTVEVKAAPKKREFKKLEKDEKGFFDKIVDSLAD